MRATAAGLLQVGRIGPDAMGMGVKEKGIEIRQPEPTSQEGGEQEQGTKAATLPSDHVRSVGRSAVFVYCIAPAFWSSCIKCLSCATNSDHAIASILVVLRLRA